ncbi:hypothetical protein [Methylosinus sp. PW1]|uniref:hypothetical protein n=1 Tax=Methylosinus sp. PW1 TaxID=107636 RepID=UPI000A91621B|nr:hypothetical protein [Methylosinus sp. PW1]
MSTILLRLSGGAIDRVFVSGYEQDSVPLRIGVGEDARTAGRLTTDRLFLRRQRKRDWIPDGKIWPVFVEPDQKLRSQALKVRDIDERQLRAERPQSDAPILALLVPGSAPAGRLVVAAQAPPSEWRHAGGA